MLSVIVSRPLNSALVLHIITESNQRMKLIERIRVSIDFKDNYRALEDNLNAGIAAIKSAEHKGQEDLIYVLNVNQFCTLFNYDLSMLMHDFYLCESEWKRRYYARIFAMLVVEFFEDTNQLFGKKLRSIIMKLDNPKVNIEKFNSIGKEINLLRSNHEKSYRQVRNAVIAHREHDTKRQIEIIDTLDLKAINSLAIDIMRWLTSFKHFSSAMITELRD
jgi:hypothetical protein